MKTRQILAGILALGLLPALTLGLSSAQEPGPRTALGTAFTYQGRLTGAGGLVGDQCDFQFSLWDAAGSGEPPSGGTQIGATQFKTNVQVADGLFTIPYLDFGSAAFAGQARWLEIAVRCPAGDGTYAALAPRQALTPAPQALYAANADLLDGQEGAYYLNASNINAGALPTDRYSAHADLAVEGYLGNASGDLAQNNGAVQTNLNADLLDGQHASAFAGASHNHLGQTWTGSNNALKIEGSFEDPDDAPLVLSNLYGHGLRVSQAGCVGVIVSSASCHGVYVGSAGEDGVYVGSAGTDGVYVGSAGWNGVFVGSTLGDGMYVDSAGGNGVYVRSAAEQGVYVASAGQYGVYVSSADEIGMVVESAGLDGVAVGMVGGVGLYVDSAGSDGVHVNSAGGDGVEVRSAGGDGADINSVSGNGLRVDGAGLNGVEIWNATYDGVQINSAGRYGVQANTDATYGLYTPDSVYVGGKIDLVGAVDPVIGERFEVDPQGHYQVGDLLVIDPDSPYLVLSREPNDTKVIGVVGPGVDYERGELMVIVFGWHGAKPAEDDEENLRTVARIKVDASYGGIKRGDLLTTSPRPGYAMKAQPVDVAGVEIYRPGTIIGKALEPLDSGQGLIEIFIVLQ